MKNSTSNKNIIFVYQQLVPESTDETNLIDKRWSALLAGIVDIVDQHLIDTTTVQQTE